MVDSARYQPQDDDDVDDDDVDDDDGGGDGDAATADIEVKRIVSHVFPIQRRRRRRRVHVDVQMMMEYPMAKDSVILPWFWFCVACILESVKRGTFFSRLEIWNPNGPQK
jgi:hypothetical protein